MSESRSFKLHSVGQISLSALIGSPLPGFLMIARDLFLLDRPKEAKRSIVVGAGMTALNFAVAFVAPASVPTVTVALPFVLLTRWSADHWLRVDLASHRAAGGKLASWWVAIAFGVSSAALILGFVAAIVWIDRFT